MAGYDGSAGNTATVKHALTSPGSPRSSTAARAQKSFSVPFLVCSMLAAGLAGGGLVVGVDLGLAGPTAPPGGPQATVPAQVVVNSSEDPAAIAAAAQKATQGVVTISAAAGSAAGTGSGIVLDGQGHILTNTHVVTLDGQSASAAIEVRTNDGTVYPGSVVGTDSFSDLAVLKVDAANLVPAVLGDSSKVNVGDTAIAIGAPLGLQGTVTNGIVSAVNRTISIASSAPQTAGGSAGNGGRRYRFAPPNGSSGSTASQADVSLDVLQTDAAVNPGNSGGPLLNAAGEVIGVNVAIASAGASSAGTQSGSIGVGFAIEINNAKRVMGEIITTGAATHGQLGATLTSRPADPGSQFTVGAEVRAVTAGSAAEAAGLQKGDLITGIDARTVQDAEELTAAVRDHPSGDTVTFTLLRSGQEHQVKVTLGTART